MIVPPMFRVCVFPARFISRIARVGHPQPVFLFDLVADLTAHVRTPGCIVRITVVGTGWTRDKITENVGMECFYFDINKWLYARL